jgi:hypothetical protein
LEPVISAVHTHTRIFSFLLGEWEFCVLGGMNLFPECVFYTRHLRFLRARAKNSVARCVYHATQNWGLHLVIWSQFISSRAARHGAKLLQAIISAACEFICASGAARGEYLFFGTRLARTL